MARMIPSVISPEVKSGAERRAFEWFSTAYGTEDWIVLHSLGIANHNKLIHGEIDFFVLAPGYGLFAIEVKGGRVSRKEGIWFFTDKYGNTSSKNRGPFDQAWDAVHSIVHDIKTKLDFNHRHLNRLFFGIGVMFPDIEYAVSGPDEEQWQIFDKNDKNNIVDYIKRLCGGASKKFEEKFRYPVTTENLLSVEDVKYIADILRGDFDRAVALSVQISNAEKDMITLTSEQYRCIDQLEDNPRCLVRGGAGTGKTLIAIQEAMKAVAKGLKVGLFCFNNNLGCWLNSSFPDMSLKPAYTGTLHRYMMEIAEREKVGCTVPVEAGARKLFYQETLPSKLSQILKSLYDRFDVIIIDEAQDLITPGFIDVFDASLSGGLSRGKWRMFGDFSMQAIYTNCLDSEKMLELLDERTSYIKFRLTINCRNSKPICEEICTITGYNPPHDMWMRIDGPPVHYITYNDNREQAGLLQQTLDNLLNSGISSRKITILSPVKREKSVVSRINKYIISDYSAAGNESINFCTIQGFKGLENSVVIITDVTSFNNTQLMYVALSRAVAGLYIIVNTSASNEYTELKLRRMIK